LTPFARRIALACAATDTGQRPSARKSPLFCSRNVLVREASGAPPPPAIAARPPFRRNKKPGFARPTVSKIIAGAFQHQSSQTLGGLNSHLFPDLRFRDQASRFCAAWPAPFGLWAPDTYERLQSNGRNSYSLLPRRAAAPTKRRLIVGPTETSCRPIRISRTATARGGPFPSARKCLR